ncbi:MAG TPA: MerR family DNA-binding transcriptional regulator [Polyangiaceae bacterium]
MDTNGRTIGKLARDAGIHVETIRYYEQRGLLKQPRRSQGWRRCEGTRRAPRACRSPQPKPHEKEGRATQRGWTHVTHTREGTRRRAAVRALSSCDARPPFRRACDRRARTR